MIHFVNEWLLYSRLQVIMLEVMLKAKQKGIQKDELVKMIANKIGEISTKFKSCIPGVPFEKIPHVCTGWSFQEGKLSTSDD